MATIIIGGGIMGLSTAFYLTESPSTTEPSSIHLIESSPQFFASASGHAGGFLAADWFSEPTAPLGKLSFDLHRQLAEQHNGATKWGYCRSTSTSWSEAPRDDGKTGYDWIMSGGSRAQAAARNGKLRGQAPKWLVQKKGGRLDIVAEDTTTAQVDPRMLCEWLLQRCRDRGVKVHQPARAVRVIRGLDGSMREVVLKSQLDGSKITSIACKKIVITAGSWTPKVFRDLFPTSKLNLPITSIAGYSLILRSPKWKKEDALAQLGGGCHAVFTIAESGFSPEMFSRPTGLIWFGGLNDTSMPLPECATGSKIERASIEDLTRTARRLLTDAGEADEGDLEVVEEALCFRPVTERGTPYLGQIADWKLGDGWNTTSGGGVWLSSGHGPWGISQGLGTGKVMAEMLEGRKTSCDVSALAIVDRNSRL